MSKTKVPFSGYALPPHEEKGGSVPARLTFFITLKTADMRKNPPIFRTFPKLVMVKIPNVYQSVVIDD